MLFYSVPAILPGYFLTDGNDARHKLKACCDLQIYKDNLQAENQLSQFITGQEINLFTVFIP